MGMSLENSGKMACRHFEENFGQRLGGPLGGSLGGQLSGLFSSRAVFGGALVNLAWALQWASNIWWAVR